MFIPTNTVSGKLVLKELPELACFTDFTDLLKALPDYLGVELPSSITNVIVSNEQPTSSQTTDVWFRLSNAGSFIGIYVFAQGTWHPIYPINTDTNTQIEWFYSTDGAPPDGWLVINTGDTVISIQVVMALTSQYVLDPTASFYTYFAARFVGF